MRKYVRLAVALACFLAVPALAPAQPAPGQPAGQFCAAIQFPDTVKRQILALLAQFPGGGPGLRAAVARLVEADPALADPIVVLAHRANPAQKEAIGKGLADAANYYAKCGSDFCRGYESRIRTAMNCADEGTRVGFVLGDAPTLARGIPGFNNAGAAVSGCRSVISPSSPAQSAPGGC